MSARKNKGIQFIIFIFIFFTSTVFFCQIHAQDNVPYRNNYILVIDSTGSMVGEGNGEENIWPDVQNAIEDFITTVKPGSRVTIYTYATEVNGPRRFTVNDQQSRNQIIQYVQNIQPNGRYTCIYKALNHICQEYNDTNWADIIYLYTDGRNNCSGYNMEDIASTFDANRDDYDYLYYISLKKGIPEEVKQATERHDFIKANENPKPPVTLSAKFSDLTFNIAEDPTASTEIFLVKGGDLPKNFTFNAELRYPGQGNIALTNRQNLKLEENQEITFQLQVYGDLQLEPGASRRGTIEFYSSFDQVDFQPQQINFKVVNREEPKVKIIGIE